MTHRERSRQILSFRSACPTFRRDDPFYRVNGAPCKIEARRRTPKIQHRRVPAWRTENSTELAVEPRLPEPRDSKDELSSRLDRASERRRMENERRESLAYRFRSVSG